MTTQTISFPFNGGQKDIPIGLVPLVDEPMHGLLGTLLKDSPPPASVKALTERVKDLTETEERLKSAKRNRARDTLIGTLPATFFAAFVGATALGFLVNPAVGVVILVLTLAYLVFCHTISAWLGRRDRKQELEKPIAKYPVAVLASPLILSHLLLTRSSSMKSKLTRLKNEVQSHASEAYRYWTKNAPALANRLDRLETRLDQSLAAIRKQPVRSPHGEQDLTDYKALLTRTRPEIQKALQLAKV
jgi:hypothetical protein